MDARRRRHRSVWTCCNSLLCSNMHAPTHLAFLKQVTRGFCLASLKKVAQRFALLMGGVLCS